MTRAISLDIETLSTAKNAVVASIGAVTVDFDGTIGRDRFMIRLKMQDQIDKGRHVSADTLKWWLAQSQEAAQSSFEGSAYAPEAALLSLSAWISQQGSNVGVWTKGPAFDGAILESLAETYGVDPAWSYRLHRDIRTLEDIFTGYVNPEEEALFHERIYSDPVAFVAHDPVADAVQQARVIAHMMERTKA